MNWLLIIVYIVFSVGGQVMFKYGANQKFLCSFKSGNFQLNIHWMSIIGGICYVVSFALFLILISKNDLSKINPILVGMTYLLSLAASIFILKESVTIVHLLGCSLIFIGVLIICKGNL